MTSLFGGGASTSSDTSSSSSGTSTTNYPAWTQSIQQQGVQDVINWTNDEGNNVWGADGQNPLAGFSPQQQQALNNTSWLSGQNLSELFGFDQASNVFANVANSQPITVGNSGGTQRIVDENGFLGAISDYMNPYTENILQPAIRKINEASDRRRKQIGHSANMSGAFGDARHAISEGLNEEGTKEQISDATGIAYKMAFDDAMGRRTGDAQRKLTADMSDQGAMLSQLGTILNAGSLMNNQSQQMFNNYTNLNDTLWNAGQNVQNQKQRQVNADREIWEAINNNDLQKALQILSAVRGGQYDISRTSSGQSTSSSNGLSSSNSGGAGIAGSIIGALLKGL